MTDRFMNDEKEPTYRFTLKGKGLDFANEVGLPIARQLLNVALGGQPPAWSHRPAVDQGGSAATESDQLPLQHSLREFLDHVEARRNPEKIVAIGEYLTIHENRSDFSKDEVLSQFRVAREPVPGNFPRDFTWALSIGWIAEDAHNRGRFYVTKTGKAAIQERFSRAIKKKSVIKPARRRRGDTP
jgi:hypothetical protein